VKLDLRSLNLEEMVIMLDNWGFPRFRAKQLFHWVHQKGVLRIEDMHNLPAHLQKILVESCAINLPRVITQRQSQSGDTVKMLLKLDDDETIEAVLMKYHDRDFQRTRATICISSQVGCVMGCAFCATGLSGFKRNLTVGEIISQIFATQQLLGIKITNVVFMGMGEPLLNFDNVVKAIRLMNFEDGLNIGWRRITISTCGLVPEIYRLAEEDMPIVLAISLHGATDAVRSSLMPVNDKYSLKKLMSACKDYTAKIGRRVTFEYALIKDVNDSENDAMMLGQLLTGLKCNVNLIPVNPVSETGLTRPVTKRIQRFAAILSKMSIDVVVREEKGTDIDAACGQLRRKNVNVKSKVKRGKM